MNKVFSSSGACRQKGVALFIALIALLAMTFAGLALIRAVDTTNVISGNLAFRQSTLLATDVGVEAALTDLGTIVNSSIDNNWPAACASGACKYYPTMQDVNTAGVPTIINWATVPYTTVDSNYTVQYVIDRLCEGPTPVTNVTTKCMYTKDLSAGSKKVGATSFTSAEQIYYRATVRVVGPRNTVSIVQALFAR
jgi:Tfp pilus assembly protein PilX